VVPYVFVPLERKNQWAERMASVNGLKVGLVWAGNKQLSRDVVRSTQLKTLEQLKSFSEVAFISLQKGEANEDARAAEWINSDYIDDCVDFLDTAALVENLDLVISVDTSMAHLAGALGKPIWLLNRFESEWRWMNDREDSPWYSSMRIFRQPAMHDWYSVIKKVSAELETLLSHKST